MAILLFAAGVCGLQSLSALPPAAVLAGCAGLSTAAAVAAFHQRRRSPVTASLLLGVAAICSGFLWAAWRAEIRLADELPAAWEGRDVVLRGRVADLPQQLEEGVRFGFRVEAVVPAQAGATPQVPEDIQLSWYHPRPRSTAAAAEVVATGAGQEGEDREAEAMPSRAGELWQLRVRLKRPHGFVNPNGFDYEAWLLQRGTRATGYVRSSADNRLLAPDGGGFLAWVHGLRGTVRDRFLAALPDAPYAGVLVALVVGDQRAIPNAQWDVFRNTGITHLVAISGMHVSLFALLAGSAVALAWRRLPWLALRLPARKAAAVAALAGGVAYGLLAGLGLPVQRALVMLAVLAVAWMLGREVAPSRVLALALLGVLLADPWAVLAPGFWLSFGAVATILLVASGRLGVKRGGWRAATRLQLGITLTLLPALLALFQSFSVVAPLANAVAIPAISFLVTPLALLAAALPVEALLHLAHWLLAMTMIPVNWLAASPWALWQQAVPPLALIVAGTGATAVLLLPRGAGGKLAALAVLFALLSWRPARPQEGEFWLTVLDLGNGLSVHLQTARHDLLYDAGPPYGPAADAGSRVVLPYLAGLGVQRLDLLLLSHDDMDHIGGAGAVLAGMQVDAAMASETLPLLATTGLPLRRCAAGMNWSWDGVAFEVLHPQAGQAPARRNNDDSCVLRIRGAGGSALLVGDIEARTEAMLVGRFGDTLASELIVVAHHGSRSSSTARFVDSVLPEAALFSSGYRNPYGHPHPAVWARWQEAGARNWRTDEQGGLIARMGRNGLAVEAVRESRPRYWHGR